MGTSEAAETVSTLSDDMVEWSQKAEALLSFHTDAHNATWNSNDGLIRAGAMVGGAILVTFAAECALKSLLVKEGKAISGDLRTHDVHKLFNELDSTSRADASAIYTEFIKAERDLRVNKPPTNALDTCLQNHAHTFKNWRYDLRNAGKFYHVPMVYATYSLLTFSNPSRTYSVQSGTSPITTVKDGVILSGQELPGT